MSNFEIDDYYKGQKLFGGCPASDECNAKTIDPKKFYIINLSPRKDGGSHWVLLFQGLYFDSFGCQPPLAIAPFVTRWNDTAYQDFKSAACGYYCLYCADNLLAGRNPTESLIPDTKETKDKSSEKVLEKYFQ